MWAYWIYDFTYQTNLALWLVSQTQDNVLHSPPGNFVALAIHFMVWYTAVSSVRMYAKIPKGNLGYDE